MSSDSQSIRIRPATTATFDHARLADFKRSQLAWLPSVGSGEQWAHSTSHEQDLEKTVSWVEESERESSWGSHWCRAFIAEKNGIPVAGLVLEAKAPEYVRTVLSEQDDNEPFVYLSYLISNREVADTKGSGAELIIHAKDQVRNVGLERLCVDCWRGNDRKLVR